MGHMIGTYNMNSIWVLIGGLMPQAKFNIKEDQARFLSRHEEYGFKDKSSMLRAAIDQLQRQLELQQLKDSADVYSEMYSDDEDLQGITESSIDGWPE
jgi:hypothetical protein